MGLKALLNFRISRATLWSREHATINPPMVTGLQPSGVGCRTVEVVRWNLGRRGYRDRAYRYMLCVMRLS